MLMARGDRMLENPTTRRVFIQKGLTMLAVGATVPTFLDQTVMAIANPFDTPLTQQPSGKDGKILVIVQLSGGNDGLMSIIQGGGYPNPNRSHFRSMDIWHSGDPAKEVVTNGWLGRFFDNTCAGCDPHVGVSIGEQLPLAMKGDRVTPLSFDKPDTYRYNGKQKDEYLALNKIDPTVVRSA